MPAGSGAATVVTPTPLGRADRFQQCTAAAAIPGTRVYRTAVAIEPLPTGSGR